MQSVGFKIDADYGVRSQLGRECFNFTLGGQYFNLKHYVLPFSFARLKASAFYALRAERYGRDQHPGAKTDLNLPGLYLHGIGEYRHQLRA